MKLALVGHGKLPIPPQGWGAVESVIWEHAQRLRARGHEVEIVNVNRRTVPFHMLKLILGGKRFDWVIVHNEKAVPPVARLGRLFGFRVAALSHSGMTNYESDDFGSAKAIKRSAKAPYHLCLVPELLLSLKILNLTAKAEMQPNGAEVSQFRFTSKGNGRAVCVGAVDARKRQAVVAHVLGQAGVPIDFVGPIHANCVPADSVAHLQNYLGAWTREELRERLTEYSALVLWSNSEAQPLVVVEAMAAGLSVVVSPAASCNLDVTQPFVHIAKNTDELVQMTQRALTENDSYRHAIRAHAEALWDWDVLVERLEATLIKWSIS